MNKTNVDFKLLVVVLFLVMIGTIMVYSSSSMWGYVRYNDSLYFFKRHLIKVVIGLCLMFVIMKVDYNFYRPFSIPLLIFGFVLLSYIVISNDIDKIRGVSRWIKIFNLSLQPSEFMKYALIFYMADALVRKQDKLSNLIEGYIPLVSILGVTIILIICEPNLGTASIIFMITFTLFFAGKVKIIHLIGTILASIPVGYIIVFKFLYKYQFKRILAYLNPDADPLGMGYQIKQSLIGLGNGWIWGVGLGNSKQKLLFLPEPYKDFIFSIIGEEFGFIGTCFIIILFLYILWRGLKIASSVPDLYGSLLATGITLSFVISALVNVAVVCNLLPTTGFPLPFLSYGGSALLFSLMAMGVLLNISSKYKIYKNKPENTNQITNKQK